MANEKFSQLPTVPSSAMGDVIAAVQSGTSVQETLQQVFNLYLSNTISHYNGNPNGFVAGVVYQLCWDTNNLIMYVCTTSGNAATAIWTAISASASGIILPANGGTGVASPTAHTIPIAQGSSNFNFLGLSNGQLLIGSTGADPVPANLIAGTNITITNGSGSITISAAGLGGFSWNVVTGSSQSMISNNGYIANNAGLVTLTLPATSAVGDEIDIIGKGAGGWLIAQRAGQSIVFGTSTTTVGVGGSLSSTQSSDSFYMICTVANVEWRVAVAPQGNITVV